MIHITVTCVHMCDLRSGTKLDACTTLITISLCLSLELDGPLKMALGRRRSPTLRGPVPTWCYSGPGGLAAAFELAAGPFSQ